MRPGEGLKDCSSSRKSVVNLLPELLMRTLALGHAEVTREGSGRRDDPGLSQKFRKSAAKEQKDNVSTIIFGYASLNK